MASNHPDPLALQLLMADVDELLTAHHATKPDLLAVADRLLVSVFAEAATEVGPALALALADSTLAAIASHIRQRIAATPPPVGEA